LPFFAAPWYIAAMKKKPNKKARKPRYWQVALPVDIVADLDEVAARHGLKRAMACRMMIRAGITRCMA
jgi:hypothetical protein